jgi:DNA primase large subunit
MARYPFTSGAKEFVGALNLSIDGIMKHPLYSAAVELGAQRVVDCYEGKFKPRTDDALSCKLTVLSYPIARMIANAVGSKVIIDRYASGEADAMATLLNREDENVIADITRELNIGYENKSIELTRFIHLSSSLAKKTPKWKLLNRIVESGRVHVEEDEIRTLLREAIKEEVKKPVDTKKIPDELKKRAKNIKGMLTADKQDIKLDKVDEKALPPCIKAMIGMLEQGTASHNAMFVMATFFTNLGLGTDDLVNIFRKSPKFNEETTRYQIEFLSGQKSNTEYTCPTCVTIKSWGLCKWDCPVKHPIQYYRNNSRVRPAVVAHGKK